MTIPELLEANITTLLGWDFYDADNEELSFALELGAPEGMSVDSAGKYLLRTPSEQQGPGRVYAAILEVSDMDEVSPTVTKSLLLQWSRK